MADPADHPDSGMVPLPTSIGGYQVLDWLGHGGMGEVFKVRDTSFERELALKLCRRMDPHRVARFVAEARLIGQLQHPAIPPIYHLGEDSDGHWFYAMKRVRGRTLSTVLESLQTADDSARRQWHLNRLISVVVAIAQAMAYAHSRGVIHRDLKPSNIMIGDYGDIYIVDWGLAKALGRNLNSGIEQSAPNQRSSGGSDRLPVAQPKTVLSRERPETLITHTVEQIQAPVENLTRRYARQRTETESDEAPIKLSSEDGLQKGMTFSQHSGQLTIDGQVLGTLQYMAPEQAKGQFEAHDQRTDIYAIGVMLWEILLGEHFRQGKDASALVHEAASGCHPDFIAAARGKRIEPVLRDICLRALEAEPARRYQSVVDLAGALQGWLDGEQPWKLIYESDFASVPDVDAAPPGWSVTHGDWCMRNGSLTLPKVGIADSFIFFDRSIHGDVRMEMVGHIEPGFRGELSMCLAVEDAKVAEAIAARTRGVFQAPAFGGYTTQFGADYQDCSKLCREDHDVAFSPVTPTPGVVHRVVAELLDGVLRMEVDGKEIFRLHDFFPLSGSRLGLYDFSGGVSIRSVRIWTPGVPKKRSCLAVPNRLFSAGLWQEAMTEYELIRESYPGSSESDEACLKSALCLFELALFDESRRRMESLLATPMWPLAYIGLSRLLEKQGRPIIEENKVLIEGLQREVAIDRVEGLAEFHMRVMGRAKAFSAADSHDDALRLFRAFLDAEGVAKQLRRRVAIQVARIIRDTTETKPTWIADTVAAYERVWTEFPFSSVGHIAIIEAALFYQSVGKKVEARPLFELGLERFPTPYSISVCSLALGRYDLEQGRPVQARSRADAVIAIRLNLSTTLRALELKAAAFMYEGRKGDARRTYEQILEQYADNLQVCERTRTALAAIG